MKYESSAKTDVGLVRSNNEDFFRVESNLGLFVVADGMGGYEKGEVASKIACDTIISYMESKINGDQAVTKGDFHNAVCEANIAIRKNIEETPGLERMGSTVVSLLCRKEKILFANLGDSRAYRLRNNRLEQVSVDHSLVQETKAAGLKKELAPQFKNIVTRALGMKNQVNPDIFAEKPKNGDIFLLCSDGLHGFVLEDRISQIVRTNINSLDQGVDQLIDAAKEGGGRDNITVVLVKILETSNEKDPDLEENFEVPAYKLDKHSFSNLEKRLKVFLLVLIFGLAILGYFYLQHA